MLYSNNYFSKELKQKYKETRLSLRYLIIYGIFLGLITFSLHFTLQTMNESILTSRFPQFMSQSYHTVLYTYLYVSFIFFLFYFLINYNYLTFYEIHCNHWYLLKKLGYKGIWMVLGKLSAVFLSVITIYTVGFTSSILLTVFLKYTFIPGYLASMYLAGLVTVLLATVIIMIGSILIVDTDRPKYYIALAGLAVYFIQLVTNFIPVARNRVLMQNYRNLLVWNLTPYVLTCLGFILIGFLLAMMLALYQSSKYHYNRQIKQFTKWKYHLDVFLYSCLAIFLAICAVIQLFILSVAFTSPAREISYGGKMPYLFQSSTMEDTIHKNDLVYFQRIDIQAPLEIGDIVLFKEEEQIYVERIISIHEDYITVDIDKYPKDSKEGVMLKSIPRTSIYGIYLSSNRYLGALILFANTTLGRLLFLVLPSILAFFHQQISKRIKSVIHKEETGGTV